MLIVTIWCYTKALRPFNVCITLLMSVCALGDGDFTVTHSNSYIDAPVGDGN